MKTEWCTVLRPTILNIVSGLAKGYAERPGITYAVP